MLQLNNNNLPIIRKKVVAPNYQREELKTGIVHIGVGGFHRAHQAYYIHKLLQNSGSLEWGICGIGLREGDRKMQSVLDQQDYLYLLSEQHTDGNEKNEVIGSIHEYILAPDNPDLAIEKMSHPDTKIVSLTITEGGYNFDAHSGQFNFDNVDVQHELEHPNKPRTVYGFLAEALRNRKNRDVRPFTIMSCDNIVHNGDVAREMLLSFTEKQDAELAEWIATEVSFPNSMVDRITPVTTIEFNEQLNNRTGVFDRWSVICEPFIQWIIEDDFSNLRPLLELVGVQFVEDVTPYEKMKIRLLNAGHSVLGITGAIHGFETIDQCVGDPVFAKFMRHFMDQEVTPILDPVDDVDIEEYKNDLVNRFLNPSIRDQVSRICSESSAKLPKFLIPTLIDNLKNEGSIELATFILASWCLYSDRGLNEMGDTIEIIDSKDSQLHEAAKFTSIDPVSFLKQADVFGDLLANERFVEQYKRAIDKIYGESRIRDLMIEILEHNS